MNYKEYIKNDLKINYIGIIDALNDAFTELEKNMLSSKPDHLTEYDHQIKVQSGLRNIMHNLRVSQTDGSLTFVLPFNQLDFTFGYPVYSPTPRLLLKVPSKRTSSAENGIIEVKALCDKQLSTAESPLTTKDTVLIVPNQEGPEEDIKDRPVVQKSAYSSGDYVIFGHISAEQMPEVYDIISHACSVPKNVNAFEYIEENITLEEFASLITKLREKGFGNQYKTNEEYRESLNDLSIHDIESSETAKSGFYQRNNERLRASSVYIPGEVLLGFHPEEKVQGGGFAVLLEQKGKIGIRPVSKEFMRKNYRHEINDTTVTPPAKVNLTFSIGHDLRDFSFQFSEFLEHVHEINQSIWSISLKFNKKTPNNKN